MVGDLRDLMVIRDSENDQGYAKGLEQVTERTQQPNYASHFIMESISDVRT